MSIIRDKTKGTLRLSQEKYIGKVLKKFNMKDAKAICQPLGDHLKHSKEQSPKTEASRRRMAKVPYASVVGSVMYTMVCTRLDIAHAVGVVSKFMSNLGREHYEAVKWLLCYLKGTSKTTLYFSIKEVVLEGLCDLDYGGCLDLGKSTTGYVFTVGGTTVSWMSRIQKCVAMSTTEAEYGPIAEAEQRHHKNPGVSRVKQNTSDLNFTISREWVSEGTLIFEEVFRGAKNPADMRSQGRIGLWSCSRIVVGPLGILRCCMGWCAGVGGGFWTKILIRLDAEDLIRCKKVCKSWKSLISHPYFVKARHTRQVNLMPYHMGIIPNYLFKYGLEHYMVGSSNGLACINSFDGDEIIVANPLTREERMLQKLPVSPVRSCWGFGYDALTDDYKVVFGAV
ncbi:retrovirus-related pol polyprotein from transposon TNT 1-94 [Tanacetum coccineum]